MALPLKISVIVCAHNEARYLPACLHSVLAQSRVPDQVVVINNASADETSVVASRIPHVTVVDEPRKGLVVARETGRRHASGDVLIYLDADCRAPLTWVRRIEQRFQHDRKLIALSGPYRYYDWDWCGRLLIRIYDFTLAPATQLLVKHLLRIGTIFYGGNFAVRREALDRIGGFDTSIEFHGEDTNLGRRLFAIGKVGLFHDCWLYTSARRYVAMGKGEVFRLYVRNFVSEIVHHRPQDRVHVDVRT
ncbi:MAG TPA: glycosyltransferase family A protein [Vicinamibacterales bacterium]|jgi:glycosyltransferase involved in cell wall biosynthesis|nr:glycosyltransferase family A protein [Vicinamibacterales bacterium]